MHTPACLASGVHSLVYCLINFVCLFIVLFVGSSSKKTVFIVRVLKLIWVNFRFFSSSSLRFTGWIMKSEQVYELE